MREADEQFKCHLIKELTTAMKAIKKNKISVNQAAENFADFMLTWVIDASDDAERQARKDLREVENLN